MADKPEIVQDILPNHCWSSDELIPTIIVNHAISARNTNHNAPYDYGSVRAILVKYGFSATYAVLRNGKIIQWAPDGKVAFHAGASRFHGQTGLNHHSVGIEWFGMDDEPFDDRQYNSGAKLTAWLMQTHKIPTGNVRMHSEVSGPNVRPDPKWDPGLYWDWMKYSGLVLKYLEA